MKRDIIMPPPGVFNRPDLYSRRRWRRVQHIAAYCSNVGPVGEMNSFRVSKHDKNGIYAKEISKLGLWYC